jgi:hypothetical protein
MRKDRVRWLSQQLSSGWQELMECPFDPDIQKKAMEKIQASIVLLEEEVK